MSASDFTKWCALMFERHRWRDVQIAEKLGCGRNSPPKWRETGAPLYIALACAALAADIPPWRP